MRNLVVTKRPVGSLPVLLHTAMVNSAQRSRIDLIVLSDSIHDQSISIV